jgi:hypothetical protein
MKSINAYILALTLSSVALAAEAEQVNLESTLVSALHEHDAEILSTLGLSGHTVENITYDVSQGFGSGKIEYLYGFQMSPTPVGTMDNWAAVCSPGTAEINQTNTQEVQQGYTYENTTTTDRSIVVDVDASAHYGAVSLDINTKTSFDTSETTTTTEDTLNIKSVEITNVQSRTFTCRQDGPFFMHGVASVRNNVATTLAPQLDPNIPFTYEVIPLGDVISVTTKAPYTTTAVQAPDVNVRMWNHNGDLVWNSSDLHTSPSGHQYYSGNSDFPHDQKITRVAVSTGTAYNSESFVKICKSNDDCATMANGSNDVPNRYQDKNLNSLIVINTAVRSTTTGGQLTTHNMTVSEFLGVEYPITTLGSIYSAQAIDNVATETSIITYPYGDDVPSRILAQCGSSLEDAIETYQLSCN